MIKCFESFGNSKVKPGDKVIVIYKDSKYYMETGKVSSMQLSGPNKGDCLVSFDFQKSAETFYHTNLRKIEEVVDKMSGEIFVLLEKDAIELAMTGLIIYNREKGFYYFEEENKWQIESLFLK